MLQEAIELEAITWRWWTGLRAVLPRLRAEAGLTQRDLARVLQTRQGNISAAEKKTSDIWGIDRVVAWLGAIGHVLAAVSPEGDLVLVEHWGEDTGRWLRNARQLAGFSQSDMAALLSVSVSSVQGIELRAVPARATTIIGILVAAGWSIEIRNTESRATVPAAPTAAETRHAWRQRSKNRARTRLARALTAEYAALYLANSRGRGVPAARIREAALRELQQAHPDQFQDLYREELRKEIPSAEDLAERPSGRRPRTS